MDIVLTPEEVRVLASLLEKELATPEYYPLSLNSLLAACNQKTSRFPVVAYDEKLMLGVLAVLQEKRLVWRSDAGRVPRYEQTFARDSTFDRGEMAVLCVLMLRGPQTAGEIKAHTERLHDFSDLGKVHETLDDLMEAGHVMKGPRLPGQKESRYAHLFSGIPDDMKGERTGSSAESLAPHRDGDERITRLEEELQSLSRDLEELRSRMEGFMEKFR